MTIIKTESITAICLECQRVFDLTDETDNAEYHYGHDCEEAE